MKVAIRADASRKIGTGHTMRCLTLAHALRDGDAEVSFISRKLKGNLIDRIEREGFAVAALPEPGAELVSGPPAHGAWAEVSWQQDAEETKKFLQAIQPDWLIVDHYAFDRRWEQFVRDSVGKLMVIDDLADRPHHCDLLLDQNLGRQAQDYDGFVPMDCRLLISPRYALLRPEFAKHRAESLKRRQYPKVENILVSMGGVDANNVTAEVLQALEASSLPESCSVAVVLGAQAPWIAEVKELATKASRSTTVICDVRGMADLMLRADLAIGAAGSSSWERCCLGLPTIAIITAENQKEAASALQTAGAVLLAVAQNMESDLVKMLNDMSVNTKTIGQLSLQASTIADGCGTERVVSCLVGD